MAKKKQNGTLSTIAAVIIVIVALVFGNDKIDTGNKKSNDKADKNSKSTVVLNSDTEVRFIDIGQGDATLIISDDETMLVDTGDKDETDTLVNYLQNAGIDKIDYLIATHPHADHIGEMPDVLNNFKVGKVIMPKVPKSQTPTSSIYKRTLKAIQNNGLKFTAASDCQLELGSCKINLFTPKKTYKNLNDYSTLVKVVHGDNSFLITGDCEKDEEKDIMSQNFDLSADVLKAGHHGSRTSSSQEFLDLVAPQYAVISCGENNDYGHPHKEALKRLQKTANKVYITKDDGTVIFKSNGRKLSAETSK